jgi:hypothetical protein
MKKVQINVELILGTKVRDADGVVVGRIEEIRAERTGNECVVESYLIGASAVVDRLSAWTLIRPIRKSLGSGDAFSLYEIGWEDMDLSDADRPKLRVKKNELRKA